MNDALNGLLDLSPPVLLWACLNLFFMFAKRTPKFPAQWIPWMSLAIGAAVYPFISQPGKVGFGVHNPVLSQVMTGTLIGGAAVGGNQAFKTFCEKFGFFQEEPTITVVSDKPNVESRP